VPIQQYTDALNSLATDLLPLREMDILRRTCVGPLMFFWMTAFTHESTTGTLHCSPAQCLWQTRAFATARGDNACEAYVD